MSLDQDQNGTTPPLEEVIRMAIQMALLQVNVSMPAQVVAFNSDKNTVDVQPCLMRFYEQDTAPKALPIINGVPVKFPRGGNFSMKWNLKKGDYVNLVFSQRSIDIWKNQGGVVDPAENRKFHLSDAVAYPGGWPMTSPIAGDVSSSSLIQSGSMQIIIEDSGKIKITNGTYELLSVLDQILTQLISLANNLNTDTTNTMMGPEPLNNMANYGTIKTQLTTLQTQLESLKG